MTALWPHAMVDLETAGPPPGGAVLRVGIVPFSEGGIAPRERWFDAGLSVAANAAAGRPCSAEQVAWWAQQSPEAVAALELPPVWTSREELVASLLAWWAAAAVDPRARVWAKPPSYDLALLRDLLGDHRVPWGRSRELCLRTLLAATDGLGIPGPPRAERGLRHSAVQDAAWQARQAVARLGGLRNRES